MLPIATSGNGGNPFLDPRKFILFKDDWIQIGLFVQIKQCISSHPLLNFPYPPHPKGKEQGNKLRLNPLFALLIFPLLPFILLHQSHPSIVVPLQNRVGYHTDTTPRYRVVGWRPKKKLFDLSGGVVVVVMVKAAEQKKKVVFFAHASATEQNWFNRHQKDGRECQGRFEGFDYDDDVCCFFLKPYQFLS